MGAAIQRHDSRNNGYYFLLLLSFTLAGWYWSVSRVFTLPREVMVKALYYALLATPNRPAIYVPSILCFIYGAIVCAVLASYFKTGFSGARFLTRLRGNYMVSAAQLRDMTRSWFFKQRTFATIPIPKRIENHQYSVVGSTGSGKSQAIGDYLESAIARKDRIVCIDPNGGFMQHFYQPGDLILNPFDARTRHWGIFNEIRSAFDVELYAVSLIPKSPSTDQEVWNAMARTIVSETMLKLKRLGRGTTDELVYWLAIAANEELQEMLQGTAAVGMFHGAEETLASIRTVLTRYITPHKFISSVETASKYFSIREWTESGTQNLWIPWREDMLPALKPLISCWIDVICASALSNVPWAVETETHLVVDEVDSLEKLNYLILAATKGRKHRFNLMTGIQSYAQLDETNGKNDALTFRNSMRNTLSLGIADMDTYTAEQVSLGLGEHEVVRQHQRTGKDASISFDSPRERLVLPSEIHTLPDLTGYVKLSGDRPIARVTLPYKERKILTPAMVLATNKWTTEIENESTLLNGGFAARDLPQASNIHDIDADGVILSLPPEGF